MTLSEPKTEEQPGLVARNIQRVERFPMWAAVSIIVLLLLLAGWLALSPAPRAVPRSVPAPVAVTPSGTPSPSPAGGPLDLSVPTTTPTGLVWRSFQGVPLPYSVDGPSGATPGYAVGYTHTARGALIAAQQISVRIVAGPTWREATLASTLNTPGRAVWLAMRSGVGDAPPPGGWTVPAGFRFVTYSPDVAVIELVSRASNGTLTMATVTLRWVGDWQLELQPDGGASPTMQPLGGLAGFVAWGSL